MIRRGDRAVVPDDRIVEEIKEFGYSVVEDVLQVEEELTKVVWNFSRIVPPKDVVDWTTIVVVSRTDNLRGNKME